MRQGAERGRYDYGPHITQRLQQISQSVGHNHGPDRVRSERLPQSSGAMIRKIECSVEAVVTGKPVLSEFEFKCKETESG